jgi:PRTRC genetic system protein F
MQSIDGLISKVFSRELSAAMGDFLTVEFEICVADGAVEEYAAVCDEHRGPSELTRFKFGIESGGVPTIHVGKVLERLEAIAEGLGETVYAVLVNAGWGSMNLFTFDHVFTQLEWLYRFDERRMEKEDNPDFVPGSEGDEYEGLPTEEELLEGVPKWAVNSQLRFTPEQLQSFINESSTPDWAKGILSNCIGIASDFTAGKYALGKMEYGDEHPVYTMGYVRFHENDRLQQAMDDYIEMANNCADNYTTMSHLEIVQLTSESDFKAWWDKMLAGFKLAGAIDSLLYLLSDERDYA